MSALPHILVVDHDATITRILRDNLADRANITTVTTIAEAELAMIRQPADIMICRDDMPDETGLMFLTRYRETLPWQKRILICPELDSDLALTLINETNVFRCLTFPCEPGLLVQAVEVAMHDSIMLRRLVASRDENRELKQQLAAKERTTSTSFISSIRAVPRLLTIAALTFGAIFALGVVTLLALYLLKSLLGIDLFPHAHLNDALPS
ncbi:MAG: hypothetical protein SynsKO_00320 [Synoicihabitans sp.]